MLMLDTSHSIQAVPGGAWKTHVIPSVFSSPASSSFAAFESPEEQAQGKPGSMALPWCQAWQTSLDLKPLRPPLAPGCAEAGMKVALQRVRAYPHLGKFAQGQQNMIPFCLASAEIPDPSPENTQKRCWQNGFSINKTEVFSSSSILRAS